MNRRDIYNKYNGHCAYCGKKIEFDDMTIDHILATSKGGSNDLANTIPSCQLCNNQKADRTIEEFRTFLENITETLDENKQYRIALRYKKIVIAKSAPILFYFERYPYDQTKKLFTNNCPQNKQTILVGLCCAFCDCSHSIYNNNSRTREPSLCR